MSLLGFNDWVLERESEILSMQKSLEEQMCIWAKDITLEEITSRINFNPLEDRDKYRNFKYGDSFLLNLNSLIHYSVNLDEKNLNLYYNSINLKNFNGKAVSKYYFSLIKKVFFHQEKGDFDLPF